MQNSGQPKLGIDIQSEDLGFHVFKLAPSALRAWRGAAAPTPDEYVNQPGPARRAAARRVAGGGRGVGGGHQGGLPAKPGDDGGRRRAAGLPGQTPTVAGVFHVCLDDTVSANIAPAALGLRAAICWWCATRRWTTPTAANLALQCGLRRCETRSNIVPVIERIDVQPPRPLMNSSAVCGRPCPSTSPKANWIPNACWRCWDTSRTASPIATPSAGQRDAVHMQTPSGGTLVPVRA